MAPPSVYTWAQEHKVMACFSVFFLGNSVESSLIQTGAFEVELNGMPIWSKLKSGRIPQGNELFDIINNQMKLSNSESSSRTMKKETDLEPEEDLSLSSKSEERDIDNTPDTTDQNNDEDHDFSEFDNEREDL